MTETPRESVTSSEPLIIVGTGGSGTRVFANIAEDAGYWMGDDVNDSIDAMAIETFLDATIDPYVEQSDWIARTLNGDDVPAVDGFDPSLAEAVERHTRSLPADVMGWGWKTPRCIFILPLLLRAYPGMKLIQIVRDGRDMATSDNQNQLSKHGRHLYRTGVDPSMPWQQLSVRLWAWLNTAAAMFAESAMPDRYLCLRFEDLCEQPERVVGQVYDFLGSDRDRSPAVARVSRPGSLGRWRTLPPEQWRPIEADGREALRRFGYGIESESPT